MRWLKAYYFEDDFLELDDGEFVYYQQRPIGPGILLSDESRAKYLSYCDLYWWSLPVAFLFPNQWVVARLLPFESGSFMAGVAEFALPIGLFVLFLWSVDRKAEGYLKRVGKPRSMDFCEEDNRRLMAQEAERERSPWVFLRVIGILVLTATVGALLDAVLLSVL